MTTASPGWTGGARSRVKGSRGQGMTCTPYTLYIAGTVLINNVVRDTHSPFGQAVLRTRARRRRRRDGRGRRRGRRRPERVGVQSISRRRVSYGRATCDNRGRRYYTYAWCTRRTQPPCAAPDVLTAVSRKLTLSTTETY